MDTTIRITAQFYENYNVGPNGVNTYGDGQPHWKPKGGREFIIKADSDTIIYADNVEEILTKMVADQSNDYEKFEYLDHEVIFFEPTELSSEDFESKVNEQYESA